MYRSLILKSCLLGLIIVVINITSAHANLIWPEMIYTTHTLSYVWLIGLGLLVEWPFVKWVTKSSSWSEALYPLFVANLVSAIIGIVAIPLFGFVFQIILEYTLYTLVKLFTGESLGTFNPLGYVLSGLFIITLTAIIEFAALRVFFKSRVEKSFNNFKLIWIAQALSVGIVVIHLFIYPS